MKIRYYSVLMFLIIFFYGGCDDIIQTDISDEKVYLVAPSNNVQTNRANQIFLWEGVEDVKTYNFQVVTKAFDSIEQLVVDTFLTYDTYQIELLPGQYQWRVIGYNGNSSTDYEVFNLTIYEDIDISTLNVKLIDPSFEATNIDSDLAFNWSPVLQAENYTFEIRSSDWNGNVYYQETNITNTSLTLETITEGDYVWGVKAHKGVNETAFATREITIDKTPPSKPILKSPMDSLTTNESSMSFRWANSGNENYIVDTLIIATDTAFNQIQGSFIIVNDTIYDYTFPSPGIYFWKVRAEDKAGNTSLFSPYRMVIYN